MDYLKDAVFSGLDTCAYCVAMLVLSWHTRLLGLDTDSESNLMQMQQLKELASHKFPCTAIIDRYRSRESESISRHMDDLGHPGLIWNSWFRSSSGSSCLSCPSSNLPSLPLGDNDPSSWTSYATLKTSLDLPLPAHTCNWQALN